MLGSNTTIPQWEPPKPASAPCPSCGHCPSCGRGGWYAPRPIYWYGQYPTFTYAYNGDPKAGVGGAATSGYATIGGSLR